MSEINPFARQPKVIDSQDISVQFEHDVLGFDAQTPQSVLDTLPPPIPPKTKPHNTRSKTQNLKNSVNTTQQTAEVCQNEPSSSTNHNLGSVITSVSEISETPSVNALFHQSYLQEYPIKTKSKWLPQFLWSLCSRNWGLMMMCHRSSVHIALWHTFEHTSQWRGERDSHLIIPC